MLASLAPAGHASIGANVSAPPAAGAWGMRAFLLATSAGQRARLMLPTGVLSGVELLVTSKYVVALSSGSSRERGSRVSLAIMWKGASISFHSTLAFSIQKSASRRLRQSVIR